MRNGGVVFKRPTASGRHCHMARASQFHLRSAGEIELGVHRLNQIPVLLTRGLLHQIFWHFASKLWLLHCQTSVALLQQHIITNHIDSIRMDAHCIQNTKSKSPKQSTVRSVANFQLETARIVMNELFMMEFINSRSKLCEFPLRLFHPT